MYVAVGLAAMIVAAAAPAFAQFKPRPISEPTTGEKYHIEAGAALWIPKADIVVSSAQFGIAGTQIDFKSDLGLTDQRFPALTLQLRPARKHKFRLQYVPLKYDQTGALKRDVIFNGQRYTVGLPVSSTLDWKAYRFGYEYDFLSKEKWFVGFIAEAKYTDVTATLKAPLRSLDELDRAQAPIPAIGGIARVYIVPGVSVTVDITGISLPKALADRIEPSARAHYVDVDVTGTWNFTNNVGAQVGYRSLDMGYTFKADSGAFTFKGIYFGAVARY